MTLLLNFPLQSGPFKESLFFTELRKQLCVYVHYVLGKEVVLENR